MATDIRRMTRDELDELNQRAKAWRSRDIKPAQDQEPDTGEQMDLWPEKDHKS